MRQIGHNNFERGPRAAAAGQALRGVLSRIPVPVYIADIPMPGDVNNTSLKPPLVLGEV